MLKSSLIERPAKVAANMDLIHPFTPPWNFVLWTDETFDRSFFRATRPGLRSRFSKFFENTLWQIKTFNVVKINGGWGWVGKVYKRIVTTPTETQCQKYLNYLDK